MENEIEENLNQEFHTLLAALTKAHTEWIHQSRRARPGEDSVRRVATYTVLRAMMNAFDLSSVPGLSPEVVAEVNEWADAQELELKRVGGVVELQA